MRIIGEGVAVRSRPVQGLVSGSDGARGCLTGAPRSTKVRPVNRRQALNALSLTGFAPALAGLAASLAPAAARAALLPARTLIREGDERLLPGVGATATLEGPTAEGGPRTVTRWQLTVPTRISVRAGDGRSAAWTGADARQPAESSLGDAALLPDASMRLALPALFGPGGLRMAAARWSLDLRRSRMALLDDTPCHVLGAQHGEVGRPTIWIEHQGFCVRRVEVPAVALQLDLSDWDIGDQAGRFPHRIVARVRGRVVADQWLLRFEPGPAKITP